MILAAHSAMCWPDRARSKRAFQALARYLGAVNTTPKKALLCQHCDLRTEGRPGTLCPQDGHALVTPRAAERHHADPLVGTVLGGQYGVVDILGQGGFGTVYQALEFSVGREVAIKVIRERDRGEAALQDLRARFRQEAKVIAQLRHSTTVKLFGSGEQDGVLYMALELIQGESLRDVLRREDGMPLARAVAIAVEVLESLHEAHELGLVHRDLKPDNVMLVRTPFGADGVKVLDFGIAKVLDGVDADDQVNTAQGSVYGSPRYMAPEQARGEASPRSDLYALGIMLFEMLTGKTPFKGRTSFDTMVLHSTAQRPDIPGVPNEMTQIVQRAMAPDPAARFADAAAMAEALKDALTTLQGSADVDVRGAPDPFDARTTHHLPAQDRGASPADDPDRTQTPHESVAALASKTPAPASLESPSRGWIWAALLALPLVFAGFWWTTQPVDSPPRNAPVIKLGAVVPPSDPPPLQVRVVPIDAALPLVSPEVPVAKPKPKETKPDDKRGKGKNKPDKNKQDKDKNKKDKDKDGKKPKPKPVWL